MSTPIGGASTNTGGGAGTGSGNGPGSGSGSTNTGGGAGTSPKVRFVDQIVFALALNAVLVGLISLAFAVPQQSTESSWRPSWRPATEAEQRQHNLDRLVEQMERGGVEVTDIEVFQFPTEGECVYVLGFSTGDVKVGYSKQPRARFHQHNRSVRQLGARIIGAWCSKPHGNARHNERELIAFCAQNGNLTTGGRTGEYFTGVAYEAVKAFALSLLFQPEQNVESLDDDRCSACKLMDDRPLTALSLMHQVAAGHLRIVNQDGIDVSRVWAGHNGVLPYEQGEVCR